MLFGYETTVHTFSTELDQKGGKREGGVGWIAGCHARILQRVATRSVDLLD